MTSTSVVGDIEFSHRSLRAGALLLRLVSVSMTKGDAKPDGDVPQLLAFIADGMLDRLEILNCATEDLEAGLSHAGEARS